MASEHSVVPAPYSNSSLDINSTATLLDLAFIGEFPAGGGLWKNTDSQAPR